VGSFVPHFDYERVRDIHRTFGPVDRDPCRASTWKRKNWCDSAPPPDLTGGCLNIVITFYLFSTWKDRGLTQREDAEFFIVDVGHGFCHSGCRVMLVTSADMKQKWMRCDCWYQGSKHYTVYIHRLVDYRCAYEKILES
jgi:hypothetical protein